MSDFKLTEGETLVAKSKADRTTNTGGIQSGTMYLTSKRLVFCCSPGFSRIALLSKLGSDETTIFAEVARDDIKLKKWLFWNRLIIDGKDTQIVVPKKILKYLEGVKTLDKAEESEVKGGGPSVKTFFIRLAFVAFGASILSIPLVNYINQENERIGITADTSRTEDYKCYATIKEEGLPSSIVYFAGRRVAFHSIDTVNQRLVGERLLTVPISALTDMTKGCFDLEEFIGD